MATDADVASASPRACSSGVNTALSVEDREDSDELALEEEREAEERHEPSPSSQAVYLTRGWAWTSLYARGSGA